MTLEVPLFSAVLYVTINDQLYGGLTPLEPRPRRGDRSAVPADYAGPAPGWRRPWLDRTWRAALGPVLRARVRRVCLLWRSRRDRLAVAVFDQVDVEVTAAFLALIVAAVALTAVFAAPSLDGGARVWTHARHMVPALPALAALSAWGWRFVPRTGIALAVATLATSIALLATHA